MEVYISVIYVQMNKWVVGVVHHVSTLPTFSPLFLTYYFIHLNCCLHNTYYAQVTDEICFCDSKLCAKFICAFCTYLKSKFYLSFEVFFNICVVLISSE
jgi:hypothetical protein